MSDEYCGECGQEIPDEKKCPKCGCWMFQMTFVGEIMPKWHCDHCTHLEDIPNPLEKS